MRRWKWFAQAAPAPEAAGPATAHGNQAKAHPTGQPWHVPWPWPHGQHARDADAAAGLRHDAAETAAAMQRLQGLAHRDDIPDWNGPTQFSPQAPRMTLGQSTGYRLPGDR